MCGIFGSLGFADNHRDQLNLLTYRGPDDSGDYFDADNTLYLGHRRLSIIDLSPAGRQPMNIRNETLWVTYNGEIYNFQEIKKNLLAEAEFYSKTDTEVLLHLYAKYGSSMAKSLRGMFAFGIYDKPAGELFLCRDRLGIKPLYYYQKADQFAFASELEALKKIPGIDLKMDPIGLDHYFSLGYIPAPYSAYKHIKKLPPGHILRYSCKQLRILELEPYWQLNQFPAAGQSFSEKEWLEALKNKIEESVKIRLLSDVPLGAFLSGGIDSSLVVGAMAQLTERPVKTFTIGFPCSQFDERQYAAEVSCFFQTEHFEEVVYPEALELLPKLVRSFGEPFADSSAIPTYYVSQMARKKVTVALSGDGGDEVFGGYSRYLRTYKYARLQGIPLPLRKLIKYLGRYLPKHLRGYGLLQRQGYDNIFQVYSQLNAFFPEEDKCQLYSEYFRSALAREEKHLFEQLMDENKDLFPELISQLQFIDMNYYLPDNILTKVDRMSMLNSLETRVPLLDHELVELAMSCPVKISFNAQELKSVPKQILARSLPKKLLYRRKQGFSLPINEWFRKEWKETLEAECLRSPDDPFLNNDAIREMIFRHQKGGRGFGNLLYALLFYKSWLNAEQVGSSSPLSRTI